jgi:Na+/melibiose symporter-like transporter
MRQLLLLGLGGACVFAVVAVVMIKVMPEPLKDSDYLIVGSVATVLSLLVLFLVMVSTKLKASDVFFKKRKKKR